MKAIASVYATFGSVEEAERLGLAMVERRLAACVNILGQCRSIYRWQGRVEDANEVAAVFKTAADRVPALIEAIVGMHSYEVPAVVAWPIAEAAPDYARWVVEESRAGERD
jgi:periplasmic divalent cation tolerance protein